jgi:hypothetical protein
MNAPEIIDVNEPPYTATASTATSHFVPFAQFIDWTKTITRKVLQPSKYSRRVSVPRARRGRGGLMKARLKISRIKSVTVGCFPRHASSTVG